MKKDEQKPTGQQPPPSNANRQDMDKAPGEERGKKEKVRQEDLKGKKIDADLGQEQRRK